MTFFSDLWLSIHFDHVHSINVGTNQRREMVAGIMNLLRDGNFIIRKTGKQPRLSSPRFKTRLGLGRHS